MAALFAVPALAADIAALENSVVRVIQPGTGQAGTGFVVSDKGHIATNHHVINGGGDVYVIAAGTSNRIRAKVLNASRGYDLAILHAPSISRPPLALTNAKAPKLAPVIAMGFPGLGDSPADRTAEVFVTEGAIARYSNSAWHRGGPKVRVIQHLAQVSPGNSGGPLFDSCGRVIGVNTAVRAEKTSARVNYASRISHLLAALDDLSISYRQDDTACAPAAGGVVTPGTDSEARRRADEARKQAEAAKDAAEAARKRAEQLQKDAASKAREKSKQLEQQADELIQRANEFETLAEQLALDAKKNAQRQAVFYALFAAGLLLTLGFVVFGPRKQIIQIIEEASRRVTNPVKAAVSGQDSSSKPGLVLSGFDDGGHPVRMVLPTHLFDQPDGAVVGRHPAFCDQVVASRAVSRRHLRIRRRDRGYIVEDLNSANGTKLNGQPLAPFSPQPLTAGDQLTIAGAALMVDKSR